MLQSWYVIRRVGIIREIYTDWKEPSKDITLNRIIEISEIALTKGNRLMCLLMGV